jgi:transposase-like protein
MQKKTTKPQTKGPVSREAIHMLALSIGAREAARRLGINESTLLSWSHRLKWKLPRRKVGRPPLELKVSPGFIGLQAAWRANTYGRL